MKEPATNHFLSWELNMKTSMYFVSLLFGSVVFITTTAPCKAIELGSQQTMYHSTNVDLKWNVTDPGLIAAAEYNLNARASVSLELATGGVRQDLRSYELERNPNDILSTRYQGGRILFSRYSEPETMGGFFWTLGAGYRIMQLDCTRTPLEEENKAAFQLNSTGQSVEQYKMSGSTGHGRFGYRYTAQSMPLIAGIHIGIQHFQGKIIEVNNPEITAEQPVDKAHREVESALERRWMTMLDIALETGFTF